MMRWSFQTARSCCSRISVQDSRRPCCSSRPSQRRIEDCFVLSGRLHRQLGGISTAQNASNSSHFAPMLNSNKINPVALLLGRARLATKPAPTGSTACANTIGTVREEGQGQLRFVETKTPEQQSCLMLHRTRHLFIRQQTAVINAIRAHLAEFGIVAPVGRQGVDELLKVVANPSDKRLPEVARACVMALGTQLRMLKTQILQFDRMIMAWHRSNEVSKRLHYIPGVGPMLATALVASVADPRSFRSGRNFSAWIGLVPKQHSSGGKDRLGSISKQGDRYLRSLFVAGALAVIRYAKIHGTKHRPWLTALLARRPTKVAAIALANKLARMAWAMMAKDEIIDLLNREVNAALADPTIKGRLENMGSPVLMMSPAEFRKLIAEETERWAQVIKFANIKPE